VGLSAGGRCNGLRSLIIGDYYLSVRGILIATVCRPIKRTGRLASCKVTIPGLIDNYLAVVSGIRTLNTY